MEKIIEIAANVSTPLALAGLVAAFLFFIVRKVLSMEVFSKLSKNHSFELLKGIINKLVWLSAFTILLGFLGYIFVYVFDNKGVEPSKDKLPEQTILYIKSGRFEPMPTFFVKEQEGFKNDFYETSFLYITVLNTGSSDLFITSMEVIDVNSTGIMSNSFSSAGLSKDISKNKPVKIPAGKEVEISFSGGIKFNGLVGELNLNQLKAEYYFTETSPKMSSRTKLIDELNLHLKTILKGDAILHVKLFSNRKNLIAEHDFTITKGTGIFDHTGKIQHPYFLGELIHWLRSPYSKNT